MNVNSLINKNGYSIIKDEYFSYLDNNFKFLQFKRLENIEFENISEYFLVEINEISIEVLFKNHKIDCFKDFQKKLISDVYFNYKNDIRWNIYLILLIRDEKLIKHIPIREIERDTNYARKYIYNEEELITFLKGSIYEDPKRGTADTRLNQTPENGWISELSKHNLSGCLTQNYQEKNIDLYLDTNQFNDNSIEILESSVEENDDIPLVDRIIEVDIGQLNRPCFDGNMCLEPGMVNLLHGANGTGKTSLLETIELAITGESSRSKLFKVDNTDEVKVSCYTNRGIKEFNSQRPTSESKKFENRWYGTPIGRGKTTLNHNFSLFNYFDTDKPYRFALEETDEETENQYLNRFSQLIFGDNVIKMQKNWLRYKSGFETKHKQLIKRDIEISNQLEEISRKIEDFKQSNSINYKHLYNNFERALFNYNIFNINQYLKQEDLLKVNEVLTYLQRPIENIEVLSNYYNKLTPEKLKMEFNELTERITKVEQDISSIYIEKEGYENELINIQKKYSQSNSENSHNNRVLDDIKNSNFYWSKYYKILDFQDNVLKRETIISELNSVINDLDLIKKIKKNWPEIVEIRDISYYISQINLDEIKESIYKTERELNVIDNKVINYKKYVGQLAELQVKIKNLGLEFLEKETKSEICPLCGVLHKNHNSLIEKIKETEFTKEEAIISELEKERIKLSSKLSSLKEKLENEFIKDRIKKNIVDCYNYIFKENQSLHNNSNIYNTYSMIRNFINKRETLLDEKSKLEIILESLEEEGFNNENITNSRQFIETDKFYNEYTQQKEIDNFEEYLFNLKLKYNKLLSVNNDILKTLSENSRSTEAILSNINNEVEKLAKDKNSYNQKAKVISDALSSIDQLNNYFKLDNFVDLNSWLYDIKFLQDIIEKALYSLNNSKEIEKDLELSKAMNDERVKVSENIIRCQDAIGVLSSLPKHEEFVQNFIRNNLGKIEYIFKSIHSPKEFTSLEFDNSGIIAIRGGNGITAKAHQMSTGQRVSLALSVMFTHFIAAPNAPRFLLLDEPVANMDDLHLLNLLDIIRELALKGTQILFTTANPDVAGLFRRKFSFFGRQFKQFEFIREDNGMTTIKELQYSPYYEEEVEKKTI
jgi:DNA repair protein SbcC/Rad50